jgi:hypothetical protein
MQAMLKPVLTDKTNAKSGNSITRINRIIRIVFLVLFNLVGLPVRETFRPRSLLADLFGTGGGLRMLS